VSRRLLIVLALLAVPVLALAGCNAVLAARDADHVATTRALHEGARALVPESARVVLEEESDCLMFRSSPSCVILLIDSPGSYAVRLASAEKQLREADWRPTSYNPAIFIRSDLEAAILTRRRGEGWERLCSGRALDRTDLRRCFDTITVRVT
jgi:hypothetical protein